MNKKEAQSLFAYDSWANELLFERAARLDWEALTRDMGTSHESLFGAMVHIVAAEEIWLSRWRDAPKSELRDATTFDSREAFESWWHDVRDERDSFLSGLSDEDIERAIDIKTLEGTSFTHSFADMFRHLVNHSSYHRGQVVSLLKAHGQEPPATDLIQFYRTT